MNSSGAIFRMSSLTSPMIAVNRFWSDSGVSLSSLIARSTLLMNRTGFTFSRSAWRSTVSVWAITPSTAQTTTIAPSTARIARVTSPPKSTWPGVSMRLMRYFSFSNSWTMVTSALLIVRSRACSCSSKLR